MSNVRNGNTFFIDTQYSSAADELQIKGIRVAYLLFTATSSTNTLVLSDSVTLAKKIQITNVTNQALNGDSRVFDVHEYPLLFPNGIRPVTVTNCVVTCIVINPTG